MKEVRVKLIERIPRTKEVESFRFLAQERLEFIAGQFSQIIFDEKVKGNRNLNKYLSFSSSPTKGYIEFTKRLSESDFSQALRALKVGDELLIRGPLGSCMFKEEHEKICFLIGGIGITPVISIIEYIIEKSLDTDVLLFYSNRTEEIAFKKELDSWRKNHCTIKVIYTVTSCQPKDTSCLFGTIDEDLINANMDNTGERIFYIFGPPAMVEAMKNISLELGVDAAHIKTESFIGY
jgi:ferredoxin-NADP reductase